jgi:methylenetetrahydrofolate reductase (NADPH)
MGGDAGTARSEVFGGELEEVLAHLARGASLETTAKHAAEVDAYRELLPPGTQVYVAWIPGGAPERQAEIAARLHRAGFPPVPHIAARELASREAAEALLARLAGEAGVTEALLIAGDTRTARGPYPDSLALMRSGLFERHGIARLGIAGYPEGHAKMDGGQWEAALRGKIDYANRNGIALTLVSQFCFDGRRILDWLRALRAGGVGMPVRIGVAGPAKIGTLVKYGIRCGIGNSLWALRSRAQQVTQLLTVQGPEPVVFRIAQAEPGLAIAGLHFFTFGGFAHTADWMQRVATGRIQLNHPDGFRLMDA